MSSIGGGLRTMDDDSDQSSTQDGSSTGNYIGESLALIWNEKNAIFIL